MAVDLDKMRKSYEDQQKGGDFISLDAGETLVYIHPPCRDDDEYEPTTGLNYVPVTIHYGVGKNNAMCVSLDPEANPIIVHPFVKGFLKQRKIKLTGECPVAEALASGEFDDEEADESRPQTRYLWGATVLGHRRSSKEPWPEINESAKPGVLFVGKTVFDGIMEAFFENGDISDPDNAILLKVKKEGEKMKTKYTVSADPKCLRKAYKLPKKLRAALAKATAEGGDCDLFRVVANLVKGPAEVRALIDGVKPGTDPDDHDDDDEDDEPTPPKRGKKAGKKAPPPPDDEEEDEDDEEEDDEDDEEPPPPPKGKKKAKEAPPPPPDDDDDDEDDDEEDDDEEDDDEEPPPPPKGKKKAKKAVKKSSEKPSADEEEDDDLGLEELESELEGLDDEDDDEEDDDEEPPPPPKGKKKATKKAGK